VGEARYDPMMSRFEHANEILDALKADIFLTRSGTVDFSMTIVNHEIS
jgi:hypothetical protein